ncbi:MAG: hypothetical protein CMH27_00530 [Micavibrio sp.]|nr:hypothetical protein [Micavibrio sp.]
MGASAKDFKPIHYKMYKPDIAIIGSSRSMQFRDHYFNGRSYTMGGAIHNIFDFKNAVFHALDTHKPKAMILQMDYWWFHPYYRNGIESKKVPLYKQVKKSLSTIFLPYTWLREGKMSAEDYRRVIAGQNNTQECRLGIMAQMQSKGYAHDGSYFYGQTYTHPSESHGFTNEFENMRDDAYRGAGEIQKIDPSRVEIFKSVIERLNSEGIDYAVVFPPFSPSVYTYMQKNLPNYINVMDKVVDEIRLSQATVYDFHDPAKIETVDCEFLDGEHGGQITYAKILRMMDDSPLTPYLAVDHIDADIAKYSGRAISDEELHKYMPDAKEIDFLQIGCRK